jgi:hypothetical protein
MLGFFNKHPFVGFLLAAVGITAAGTAVAKATGKTV